MDQNLVHSLCCRHNCCISWPFGVHCLSSRHECYINYAVLNCLCEPLFRFASWLRLLPLCSWQRLDPELVHAV